MNLQEEILKEHSKRNTNNISLYIGNDTEKFAELVQLFCGNNYRLTQRASWIVSGCVLQYNSLIKPYWKKFIEMLKSENFHVAAKRNIMRIFEDIEIPEKYCGIISDLCFRFLDDNNETLAVRVYSMQVLYNISLKYNELQNEIAESIERNIGDSSAGFKARGKKILLLMKK